MHIAYLCLPKAATICFLRHRYCRTVCVMKMSTSEENPFLVWNSTENKTKDSKQWERRGVRNAENVPLEGSDRGGWGIFVIWTCCFRVKSYFRFCFVLANKQAVFCTVPVHYGTHTEWSVRISYSRSWFGVWILFTERASLRQYIDRTIKPASLGDADRIWCVNNSEFIFLGGFGRFFSRKAFRCVIRQCAL
jgi:hypothetical protein